MYRDIHMDVGQLVTAVTRVFVCALFVLAFSTAEAYAADSPHIRAEIDTSRCAACHAVHTATSPMLIRHISPDGSPANPCMGCHAGSNPEAANISTGVPDSFALASGHSLTEVSPGTAKIEGCATCHNTHGSVADDGRMIPAKTINGVAVTSAGKQLCLACHSSSADWFGPDYPSTSAPTRNAAGYPVAGTWPGTAAYASSTNAHRLLPETTITVGAGTPQPREQGDCRYCHASHRGGNYYDSLLSTFTVPTNATLVADKADGSYADLCFKCHGGVKPEGFPAAPRDIQSFATSTGVSAGHSIVTSGGLLPVGSPLPCFECHNPHGSNRGNDSMISDALGGSLSTTGAPEKVRRFCFTCHTTADTTEGWDSTAYAAVAPADTVVGIPRAGGVLHLSDIDGHRLNDPASCYDCHGNSYVLGENNVHNPRAGTTTIITTTTGLLAASQVGSDTLPPTTTANLSAAPSGAVSLTATDTGSGVDVTYSTLDGGNLNVGTQILAATEGTHTIQYWSTDTSGNVEPASTAVFYVDLTAPVTTSDALASYAGTATITLSAVDEPGGSGVAATWFRLDGGLEATGSVVTTDTLGDHTLEFWSVDVAGNVESSLSTTFTVTSAGGLTMVDPLAIPSTLAEVVPSGAGLAYSSLVGRQPPPGFAAVSLEPARVGTG